MDDLYNNLKIYETEVKGSSSSNQNSQNVAFVSSNNSGSSNQAIGSNSANTDKMDLKWQMAMLTMRARRFLNKTGRGHFTREKECRDSKGEQETENCKEEWTDENETECKSKQRKPSFAKVEFVKSNEHVKIPRESVEKDTTANSKAFWVLTSRTRIVEENLHVKFNEETPNIVGNRPNWLFDIDALTKSMNYEPVIAGNQSNGIVGTKACENEGKSKVETKTQGRGLDFRIISQYGQEGQLNKMIYRNKKDKRGIVVRNKAQLVAQGYTQEEGIDYDEVFAPVARIEAIRLFLAYASFKDFVVSQMDMKSAFLYSKIEEEVYVMQKEDGIFISQDKYMDEILKKFGFSTVKTTSTPMETSKPLLKDENAKDVDVYLYRSMIGSLMYLTSSRPDIMFAVCACARFQVTPKVSHLHAVKRIFRYLKGQPKLGLWYPKDSPFDLEAYSDSDYAATCLDRKSTTGGFQFLGSRLISLQCKKQTIVANFTTEAEYVAAANCYGQVLWIQNQMLDYRYNFMNTKIFIDSESTICIVKNPVFHSKTKHIKIRHHFIRDSYEKRLIQVIIIHTNHNVADLLTKALDVSRFQFLTASIRMLYL
ncbi:putative ribonuclease H-like domain-containing protein [Tanacetum coccineum]